MTPTPTSWSHIFPLLADAFVPEAPLLIKLGGPPELRSSSALLPLSEKLAAIATIHGPASTLPLLATTTKRQNVADLPAAVLHAEVKALARSPGDRR